MPERQRAYYKGELVTVLRGSIGGRGKTEIRNQFGYRETVPAKELQAIGSGEKEGRLRYSHND